jgi:hypothetical protein
MGIPTQVTIAGIPQVQLPVSTAPLYRLETGRALTASTWSASAFPPDKAHVLATLLR